MQRGAASLSVLVNVMHFFFCPLTARFREAAAFIRPNAVSLRKGADPQCAGKIVQAGGGGIGLIGQTGHVGKSRNECLILKPTLEIVCCRRHRVKRIFTGGYGWGGRKLKQGAAPVTPPPHSHNDDDHIEMMDRGAGKHGSKVRPPCPGIGF